MVNYYDYVKSHPEDYKQFSCKDLLFLICECPPEFTKTEDWTDHHCFFYILNGNLAIRSREQTWQLQQGDTVFMKKGGCGIEKKLHDASCSLLFYVPDAYIRSFARENAALFSNADLSLVSRDLVLPVETNTVLTAFFDSVISHFMTGTQPPEDLVELKFRELLLNIISNPVNNQLKAFFYKISVSSTDDLQDVMERNCLYDLQVHEYARLCHRSLSSFKRDFNTAYGVPPGRWLLEKRLENAHRLLLISDRPVTEIANESGFRNMAHFSRAFKAHYGVSPLQSRKQVTMMTASTHSA